MPFIDLHNEDGFPRNRKRVTRFEGFLRAAEHVSPNVFFREILRRFGPFSVRRQDVDRALFLFERVQWARERVYFAFTSVVVALVVPVGSFFVIDPYRWPALLTGIGIELLLGAYFSSAHRVLTQRRNDYQVWLGVVHRAARSRSNKGGPDAPPF
ncbi:MAG: hypothetical protein JO015_10105 [Verrucomicrobia bacterium]|nr:hypothetical protein [Verrucomicrobiota bacterium]